METKFKVGGGLAEIYFMDGPLPGDYRCDFDSFLFNTPENLSIQTIGGWHSFYAVRKDKKAARARVHFHIEEGIAMSPYKNPFGSFEFSDAMLPREMYEFISWTEKKLIEKGVKKIIIKSYPELYNANGSALLSTFLLNQGYHIQTAELSACIKVNANTLYSTMTSWEKRRSGQLKRSTLRFSQLPRPRMNEVYQFINSCREERKQSLSLSFPQLKTVSDIFPDRFLLFGMFDVNALVAASISILINNSILYNFYSAHAKQYDNLSPVVRLMEGMYEFCQAEKIKIIDLGTSAFHGRPNFSLLDFKLHLGASPTQKFTFEKNFD